MKRGGNQRIRRGMILGLMALLVWGLGSPPLVRGSIAPAPVVSPPLTRPSPTIIEPPFSRIPYEWEISGGTAIILRYTGSATAIEIPATVGTLTNRYPVTAIASRAFMEKTDLTKVVIPEGVTSIGTQAFAYCLDLTEISLPTSLRDIGASAFTGCRSLTRLEIPAAVSIIGVQVFFNTHQLREVWFLGSMPAIYQSRVNWNPVIHAIFPASLVIPGLPEAGDWGRVFSGDNAGNLRLYYPAGASGWVPTDQIRPFYSVTYDLNGGTGPLPVDELRYPEGSRITLLAPDPAMAWTVHQFLGWSTRAAGTGDSLAPGSSFPMGNSAVRLYAQWGSVIPILIPIRVSFDANGGQGAVSDPVDGTLGNAITLPGQGELTRTAHRFTGWNTAPDGSGESFPGESFTPRKDHLLQAVEGSLVLYAQWQGEAYALIRLPDKVTANEPFRLEANCFEGDRPLVGRELIFRIDGKVVGQSTTGADGRAVVEGITEPSAGTHQVAVAQFIDGTEQPETRVDLVVASAPAFPLGVAAALAAAAVGGAMLVWRRLRAGKHPPSEKSPRPPVILPPGLLVAVDFRPAGSSAGPLP